mmetsp:Transcript_94/g.318  ORF Transcript_94/g.318 Transcript_94/m.318 type:complete len:304 (+) Transcript_94:307-1218(+)
MPGGQGEVPGPGGTLHRRRRAAGLHVADHHPELPRDVPGAGAGPDPGGVPVPSGPPFRQRLLDPALRGPVRPVPRRVRDAAQPLPGRPGVPAAAARVPRPGPAVGRGHHHSVAGDGRAPAPRRAAGAAGARGADEGHGRGEVGQGAAPPRGHDRDRPARGHGPDPRRRGRLRARGAAAARRRVGAGPAVVHDVPAGVAVLPGRHDTRPDQDAARVDEPGGLEIVRGAYQLAPIRVEERADIPKSRGALLGPPPDQAQGDYHHLPAFGGRRLAGIVHAALRRAPESVVAFRRADDGQLGATIDE